MPLDDPQDQTSLSRPTKRRKLVQNSVSTIIVNDESRSIESGTKPKHRSPFASRLLKTIRNVYSGANAGSRDNDTASSTGTTRRKSLDSARLNSVENEGNLGNVENEPGISHRRKSPARANGTVPTDSEQELWTSATGHAQSDEDVIKTDAQPQRGNNEKPTSTSSRKRKKYKGWAWLDDNEGVKVKNQDEVAKIAEDAAKSAIDHREGWGELQSDRELQEKPASTSTPNRKKHKGWAWLEDSENVKVNNQDRFAKIAEDATKAAASSALAVTDDGSIKRLRKSTRTLVSDEIAVASSKAQTPQRLLVKKQHDQANGPVTETTHTSGFRSRPTHHHKKTGSSTSVSGKRNWSSSDKTLKDPMEAELRKSPTNLKTAGASLSRSDDTGRLRNVDLTLDDRLPSSPNKPMVSGLPTEIRPSIMSEGASAGEGIPTETWSQLTSELANTLAKDSTLFEQIQSRVLEKLTKRRNLGVLPHHLDGYQRIHQLLSQTVQAGEGNSMLVIGSRGCGKSAVVETAISELYQESKDDFLVVRLNGFIHTDDKIALREIWRQLGRELDDSQDDNGTKSSYADTLTSLLALLSHQDESQENCSSSVARSVIFILDEFDLFTAHPRQTLLYNLFDVAQSYRNAPIAVLGLTTKVNIVENLEKRVKSRFGQRYVHLSLPRNLQTFRDICVVTLTYHDSSIDQLAFRATSNQTIVRNSCAVPRSLQSAWNKYIAHLLSHPALTRALNRSYYTTKRPLDFMTSHLLPLILSLAPSNLRQPPFLDSYSNHLLSPDSALHQLPSLTTLQVSLLIATCHLDLLLDTELVSFESAYAEYLSLASRTRVQQQVAASANAAAGVSGLGISGGRVWGREIALVQWESLAHLGLIVPASGAGGSTGGGAKTVDASSGLWRVDVGLDELGAWLEGPGRKGVDVGGLGIGVAGALAKWCRRE